MSELGYISKRYKRISRLTNDVNRFSIAVKKYSLLRENRFKSKYPKLIISEDEYVEARKELIQFIEDLLQLIKNGASENDISMLVKNRAFNSQVVNNPELNQEFERLLFTLKKNNALHIEQFKPLDTLIGVLDNERSNLFRKMRNVSE
jgi:hypothetical protein